MSNEIKKDDNYNCKVTFEDNTHIMVYANTLRNMDLAKFNGWRCSTGSLQIYIDSYDQVWSCNLKNKLLGVVDDFELFTEETGHRCRFERCSGTTDNLMAFKSRD